MTPLDFCLVLTKKTLFPQGRNPKATNTGEGTNEEEEEESKYHIELSPGKWVTTSSRKEAR